MFVSFNTSVKILLYVCVRRVLIFPLAQLKMCRGDNLVDCAYECLCRSICENLLYACVRCAYLSFSVIRLTIGHGDNFANHAFKGYSIFLHSIMTDLLLLLKCSVLW